MLTLESVEYEKYYLILNKIHNSVNIFVTLVELEGMMRKYKEIISYIIH